MPKITLIVGGARSGKSAFALSKLMLNPDKKYYLATCPSIDKEMDERILKHKKERQNLSIETIEEELNLKNVLNNLKSGSVLVDCLTLWINNHLYHNKDLNESLIDELTRDQFRDLPKTLSEIIVVTNEVGLGLVPIDTQSRTYRDLLGRANQVLGELCDEAYSVTCGIPLKLK